MGVRIAALAVCLLCVFSNPVFATDVSGFITADETWMLADSPYVVTADVKVTTGNTLTIEPGVLVQFNDNVALNIEGALVAIGTSVSPIVFTATNSGEFWRFINFSVSSDDAMFDMAGDYASGSIIEYATIENAGNQTGTTNGAIQLINAHPFLNKLTVRNNLASGVYGNALSSVLKIFNSSLSGNKSIPSGGGGGIFINGGVGSQVEIKGNQILNNDADVEGGGVRVLSIDTLIFDNNIVSGNEANGDGGGVYINGLKGTKSQNKIINNTINNNVSNFDGVGSEAGGGIWVNNSDIELSNNIIKLNDSYEGGGVYIGNTPTASYIISKNIIQENTALKNGGGIHIDDGMHNVIGNIFYKNTTTNLVSSHGGGIDIHEGLSTLTNNIIAENSSYKDVLNLSGVSTVNGNAVLKNTVNTLSAFPGLSITDFSQNTIIGNSAPGSIIVINNLMVTPTVNNNNIIGNMASSVIFSISENINADSNWWGGTTDPVEIQNFVVSSTGTITTATPLSDPSETAPLSPPSGVNATAGASDISLTWNANPELDVAGYKVYWGSNTAPDFDNVEIVVGDVTSFTIPSLMGGIYFIAVTAYDATGSVDDLATIVNEDQTAGTESWFSQVQQVSLSVADLSIAANASVSSVTVGGAVTYSLTVTNNGPNVANNVVVTGSLPAGTTFVSASTGCTENAGSVTCNVALLGASLPNNDVTFDITVNASNTAGTSTISATATADEFDPAVTDNTISVDTTVNAAAAATTGGGGGSFSALTLLAFSLLLVMVFPGRKYF